VRVETGSDLENRAIQTVTPTCSYLVTSFPTPVELMRVLTLAGFVLRK